MHKNRLILVSNRLPFKITERNGRIEFLPSSGGLVTSITSYVHKKNSSSGFDQSDCPVWVGSSDIGKRYFYEHFPNEGVFHDGYKLAPVHIPASMHDKFYNGFCNDTIWPLFHYFPSYAKFVDEYYDMYQKVNKLFCEKVIEIYEPGDIIWIHDYHLMLLPALLRKKLPNATIGFFLHIPFPSFELFRLLPSRWRREILLGLLGADVIGFHTNDYVQSFLKSIRQILGYDNMLRVVATPERSITVDVFPISIDYHKFNDALLSNEIFTEKNKIKKRLYDAKLIISVDRLDYAKGLINRLESFDLFLSKYPEYKKKVVYILLVVPSRDIIAKYKETKSDIEGVVSRINGKYGGIGWTPVIYQYKTLDFKKLLALYTAADVALIVPMRDGMNLVAKEFVASRSDRRGVLILSETAGAAAELGGAILVNPNDRLEIAESLNIALSMPVEEQVHRNDTMRTRLREYDVMKWAEDFISQLLERKAKQETLKVKEVTGHTENSICINYSKASKRLLFLDYDGTLVPMAAFSHQAVPDKNLINLLTALAEDKKNDIVISSGRTMDTLEKWFGHIPVHLVAEHGAFYKRHGMDWLQTIPVGSGWKPAVIPIMSQFTDRCAGTWVEEKNLSVAWHYRNAEKDLGFLRSRELVNALLELSSHLDFQIIEGKRVVEAKARGINKGVAATVWLKENQCDFILAIGDDKTDEDLFRVIPASQYSILVGLKQSRAKYNFKQQQDVLDLLDKLNRL